MILSKVLLQFLDRKMLFYIFKWKEFCFPGPFKFMLQSIVWRKNLSVLKHISLTLHKGDRVRFLIHL